ncbi:hypothetical protein ZIOFF_019545 [Zingiber officinale]|uniref:RNase III domain-containing protein n=1 Tax=Zingiber officinale TaxID=94328 RepID=A0A8J5LT46_ZINOF|nr:hypothetical protein ZIOFF_019545 [Zingiber officinale]
MEPLPSKNGKAATELCNQVANTHGSYVGQQSNPYQRLEFVGDVVLGLVVSDYLYEMCPHIDSDDLTALRSANVSNEKLPCMSVDLSLYRFLRHNSPSLDQAFTYQVTMEEAEENEEKGSILKARLVLADMVESIAAAVYRDCNSNLKSD